MENKISLVDGRYLGYSEYGNPHGKCLFYFHGHPGSRFEAKFLAECSLKMGIRLIGIDRPGMGNSSFQKNRNILDWPNDVLALADALKIDCFSIAGFSGGGPYVLACAFAIKDRLERSGFISGVSNINILLAFLSQWVPFIIMPLTSGLFRSQQTAENALIQASKNWVAPDQESLKISGIKEIMASSLVEGLRQGSIGASYDGALLGRAWGFRPDDVQKEVFIWHGELDKEVPVSTAKNLALHLPQSKLIIYPNDGHISTIVNHSQEIMENLL
jgi:pimeloyl-ACP methyl ester carboxylesterase